MHAWFMDAFPHGDRRLPHHEYPPRMLNVGELREKTKCAYFKVDMDDPQQMAKRLSTIRHDKNHSHVDILRIDHEHLNNQTQLLNEMYRPTVRSVDLVHLITGGAIYYDVCPEPAEGEEEGRWIRIFLERGDLITIPKGLKHRCTTTGHNFVRVKRFHQAPVADS
ncbi:hypothetical protein M3Y99_01747800 [Aphelenchoides fujianensis]|nr:hypothetical protein M3Y99_01747800 [Aphelenchoides fujianensis]